MSKKIPTKVRGVTFDNEDGSSHQKIIKRFIKRGDYLPLEREPGNQRDSNAIAVHAPPNASMMQDNRIGYIASELSEKLAPIMDSGHRITCRVLAKTGGEEGKDYGVNIELEIFSPGEIAKAIPKRGRSQPAKPKGASSCLGGLFSLILSPFKKRK